MIDRIPLAGFEALYEDLQLCGDWSAVAPDDGLSQGGRVLVDRAPRGGGL